VGRVASRASQGTFARRPRPYATLSPLREHRARALSPCAPCPEPEGPGGGGGTRVRVRGRRRGRRPGGGVVHDDRGVGQDAEVKFRLRGQVPRPCGGGGGSHGGRPGGGYSARGGGHGTHSCGPRWLPVAVGRPSPRGAAAWGSPAPRPLEDRRTPPTGRPTDRPPSGADAGRRLRVHASPPPPLPPEGWPRRTVVGGGGGGGGGRGGRRRPPSSTDVRHQVHPLRDPGGGPILPPPSPQG